MAGQIDGRIKPRGSSERIEEFTCENQVCVQSRRIRGSWYIGAMRFMTQ